MPTYPCRVLAFFDDDLLELDDFPYQLAGDHDPQAGSSATWIGNWL